MRVRLLLLLLLLALSALGIAGCASATTADSTNAAATTTSSADTGWGGDSGWGSDTSDSSDESGTVEVPDVTGESAEDAESEIEDVGLTVSFDPEPDDPSLCTVSDQDEIGEADEGTDV